MATVPVRHPPFGGGLQVPSSGITGSHASLDPAVTSYDRGQIENPGVQLGGFNVTTRGMFGGVRTRPGVAYSIVYGTGAASLYEGWTYNTASAQHVVYGAKTTGGANPKGVVVLNASTGAVVATSTDAKWATTTPTDATFWSNAVGTTSDLYLVNGDEDTVFTWNGTTFTDKRASMSGLVAAGKYIAVAPWSPRMVMGLLGGGVTGIGKNRTTIRFSELDNPLSWGLDDYVDLQLSAKSTWATSHEKIIGLAPWTDYLFVITTDRVFAFYGESTDDNGVTEYLYREVAQGKFDNFHVTPDGLMVYGIDGVFITNGGPIQKLSTAIDGLINQWRDLTDWPDENRPPQAGSFLSGKGVHFQGADYFIFGSGWSDLGVLVREPDGAWQYWAIPGVRSFVVAPQTPSPAGAPNGAFNGTYGGTGPHLTFTRGNDATNDRLVYVITEQVSTDAINATDTIEPIDAWVHFGWLADDGLAVKSVREIKVTGSGNCNVEVATDHTLVTDPQKLAAFDTTDGAVFETLTLRGPGVTTRGTYLGFSARSSVVGYPFAIKDVTYMVRATRSAGTNRVDR